MSKNRIAVLLVILAVAAVTVCFLTSFKTKDKNNNQTSGMTSISTDVEEVVIPTNVDTIGDNYNFTTNGETTILLSGTSATVNGSGVSVSTTSNGTTIEITSAGTYHVTGSLEDGQIVVNAPKEKVKIILDNASIISQSSSAIYVYKSEYTIIELASGTTNTLTDAFSYDYALTYSSEEDVEPNATLYSKSDLIIDGLGTLNVNANHSNGIISKDNLKIVDAVINITAENNGINGKDSAMIQNAIVTINAKGDGIRSTNDTDETLGFIQMENSTVNITAGEDGIQAETNVTISGGTYTLETGSGYTGKNSSDSSMKGIKAGKIITIDGAIVNMNSVDDAIHSNGNVNILSGTYTIKTLDDGIHADETIVIVSGDISIPSSHEALEGDNIIIYDGNLDLTGDDDGINVNGGVNNAGMFGGRNAEVDTSANKLVIKGGNIIVHSNGDGLDSNGSIEMSGGTVIVYGPTNSGNGAIDYDGTFNITGGTLIAIGSSGMAMSPSSTSSQSSLMYNVSNGKAGSEIILKDASGKEIIKVTAEKQFNNVVISTPEITSDGNYTLTVDGTEATATTGNAGFGGGMGGFGGGRMFNTDQIPEFNENFEGMEPPQMSENGMQKQRRMR